MATRATSTSGAKKKASSKAASAKAVVSPKKASKKSSPKPTPSQKVDYYPNRMTLAVSVLAGTLLVLISLIAVLGIQ